MSIWNHRANEIFLEALDQPESIRPTLVQNACAGDSGLERQVEGLLAAFRKSRQFIEQPARVAPAKTHERIAISASIPFEIKYQLLEMIGQGGMGVVYRAEQTTPIVRPVAVKLIDLVGARRDLVARFEQERQTLALMDHPNIAKVLDAGATHTGQPFLVMEYIAGEPFTNYCDRRLLPVHRRLELFIDLCRGLQHAHQKGVIHRDLKPSNVLVGENDGRPVVKVIDFGVAKLLGPGLFGEPLRTQQGMIVGTLEYMAPEQAGFNGDIDTRADVYSLGVILYELLTSLRPHDRGQLRSAPLDELVRILREEEPPSLSNRLKADQSFQKAAENRTAEPKALLHQLSGDLNWIVQRCLAKDRELRYASAKDLADDIERFLCFQPIEARPVSSAYRFRKFVRRRRAFAATAAIGVIALVLGGVGAGLGFFRAERARQAEAVERGRAEFARDRAWDALDAATSTVIGESLATQMEVAPEQKQFLNQVLSSYRELAGQSADDDRSRIRVIVAACRVGAIEHSLARRKEAIAAYQSAVALANTLASSSPNDLEYRRLLARCYSDLSAVAGRAGHLDEQRVALDQAITHTQLLVDKAPQDLRHSFELANHYRSLGSYNISAGKTLEGIQSVENAMHLLTKLTKDRPSDSVNFSAFDANQELLLWARCHGSLAIGYRLLKKLALCERHLRSAILFREKIPPNILAASREDNALANDHSNLGKLLCEMDRVSEGIEYLQKSRGVLAKLKARFPSIINYHQMDAVVALNLAPHLGELGRRDEERALIESSVDALERLLENRSDTLSLAVDLGGAYCNLGIFLREEKRFDESIRKFDQAVEKLKVAFARDARLVKTRQFLRNSYIGRANSKQAIEDWKGAHEDWLASIPFITEPKQSKERSMAAYTMAKSGRFEEAVQLVEQLTTQKFDLPFVHLIHAQTYAVVASGLPERAQELGDRSIVLLQKAAREGLKHTEVSLKQEDWKALRGRAEFQKILDQTIEKDADRNGSL